MRYEAGNLSTLTTATADAPLVAIRAPAAAVGRLLELGVTLTAATATRLGLIRAATVSTTPGTTKVGRNTVFGAPDSATLLVSSWAAAPTLPGTPVYHRRISLPAAIGAGFVWSWPADRPLHIGDGTAIRELVLANLVAAAPSLFEYWAVWED